MFDKEDGTIDGIPPGFESKENALPWVDLIRKKTSEIIANRSDIDGYATTNHQEFFAVASEYFFEQPHLLKRKHPKTYALLTEVFQQDPTIRPNYLAGAPRQVSRNSPCPCGSGLKYKKCCLTKNA